MKNVKFSFKQFANVFIDRFVASNTTTWAASLAFFTALSLAPLLVLFVTLSAQFSPSLQQKFVSEASMVVGYEAGETIKVIIDNAKERKDLSSISGFFGIITLLLSASFIFGELRAALNQMFDIKIAPSQQTGIFHVTKGYLKVYIFQMGLVFAFLFIMIVSLVMSTALSASVYTEHAVFKSFLNVLISILIYMGLFTLLFHYVPSERLTWRRAWHAGLLTALLFVGGKELIGIYLGNSALSTTYGAAGSLVVLLAWVYYSAVIVFIGAHCTSTLAYLAKKDPVASHAPDYVPLKEAHDA